MEGRAGLHLAYCTNIHPASGWDEVFASLRRHAPEVRTRVAPEGRLGLGLRLSAAEARQLLEGERRAELREWLDGEGLYVALINGFVHGDFHGEPVRDAVFAPDWREEARVEYTLDLVRILSALLPEGMDGGVSTAPLSYKPWPGVLTDTTWQRCVANLTVVVETLARLAEETGQTLHLDLEPEPGGLLETSRELVDFFQHWLLPLGARSVAERLGVRIGRAEELVLQHIRVCLDTCHLAVEYEDPDRVWERFESSGVGVGRLQVTSALEVKTPVDERALGRFVDPVYLHQVMERGSDMVVRSRGDLRDALGLPELVPADSWRVHFHVPLFMDECDGLRTTQADTARYLRLQQKRPLTTHLELETYTWDVLPPELKLELVDSIAREYQWVQGHLG